MSTASVPAAAEVLAGARRLLVELCAISSASGDRDGLRRMARRLGSALGDHGLRWDAEELPDRGGVPQPLLVARGPADGDRVLLLLGHLDTVLPAVPPRVEGDVLQGTGALDMKGGLATLLGALALMALRGVAPPRDLVLVAVPDEEVGGAVSEHATRLWGARARAVLVLEPGERREDAETLVTGRRGLLEWRLSARGRAAHSGLAYWEGRSAAAATARWCHAAQALSEPDHGPVVNVARVVAGDTDFVEHLGQHHNLLGGNRRLNVVAERALAEGEVRFLRLADRDRAVERLRHLAAEIAADSGVELELTLAGEVPPVDPRGPGCALAERTVELARRAGWALELEEDRGGISFPNFLPDPGALPVLDGLGPVGGGMHTRGEHVDLTSLDRRVVLLADLLAELRE